ncbi:hypothetical protein IQ266_09380 [filamentous cyanobacterium LEGE 11480]|uniref:Uncharacterized protein n=1 Tax=Romeriopsis navalis LEGE 11480 TaxID=2777977 RepID=A0A928VLP9_9CYAN|nr:hypothetical protein [Romeriopsis navalis]MBE9029937.1 hypothetical protein [Romeriopsis navalis LEGE 11480]
MIPYRLRRPTRSLLQVATLPRRQVWLSHRSLDLALLAGSACLLTLLSQPIATALTLR